MKAKNWIKENQTEKESAENKTGKESNLFYGRTYNEEVPFSQVNFQTFQNILDKRNELLNSVKSLHNQKFI